MKKKEINTKASKIPSSFSDLYAMYNFANSIPITKLTGSMKAMVKSKVSELENEIFMRLFEVNPFKTNQSETVTGRDPMQVLQAMGDDNKTFVVVSSKETVDENK